MNESDPRQPIIIGIVILAVLMLGGMIWAVTSSSGGSLGGGEYDANASFIDEGDPTWGPDGAKVTIRIFEDFQCPACKTAHRGLNYVKEAYVEIVKLVWNDFPLDGSHPNARIASNAARCAEEQGKFWDYADALYSTQSQWSNNKSPSELFIKYAKQMELNEAAFTVCLDGRRYNEKIQNDVKEGRANRVNVTPTFFVNRRRYTGVLSADDWDKALKPLLGDSGATQEEPDEEVEEPSESKEPELIGGAEPIELPIE
jgi:protein-disulfide isomerase